MPDHRCSKAKYSSPEFLVRTMKNDLKQRILNGPSKERQLAKNSGLTSARVDQASLLAEQRHGQTRDECGSDRIEQQSHFAAGRMSLWNSHLQSATILVATDYPEIELS